MGQQTLILKPNQSGLSGIWRLFSLFSSLFFFRLFFFFLFFRFERLESYRLFTVSPSDNVLSDAMRDFIRGLCATTIPPEESRDSSC